MTNFGKIQIFENSIGISKNEKISHISFKRDLRQN